MVRKRPRVEPTDDLQEILPLCWWPEQVEYERIRQPSSTTNGPKAAATSGSTSSPEPRPSAPDRSSANWQGRELVTRE